MTKTVNLIWWKFEPHLSYEYDWLNWLLSGFEVNHIVDPENNTCVDNAIIVANLSQIFFAGHGRREYYKELRQFSDYIKRFKQQGVKVGLFHLGDEYYKESTGFYRDLDFVFRQYHKPEDHKKYKQCYYLPFGYKSGFCNDLTPRSLSRRDYLWSFAGQLKGSRYEMIKHAQKIAGGSYTTTTQWNDPKGLTTKDYADLLSNTKFSLCPMGNHSVDCFRVYESLEAGAIPIIEAKGLREVLAILFNPQLLLKYGTWDRNFWSRNYRYWKKTYPDGFPCPLIYSWKDLEALIDSADAEVLSERTQKWWKDYKKYLANLVQTTIAETFF